MITIQVTKNNLVVENSELLTSGSVGINDVQFVFDSSWDGVGRTAIFKTNNFSVSVVLGVDNACKIPYEVLVERNMYLSVGVYGTKDGTTVIPTLWGELGCVNAGAQLSPLAGEPTPTEYQQIMSAVGETQQIAQSVRDDADSGKFDGFSPTAKVTPSADGAVVTITDKNGTTEANIKNGVSPTATVKQTDTGAEITVTDATGTTTATLANGADYNLTEADKTEIAQMLYDEVMGVSY